MFCFAFAWWYSLFPGRLFFFPHMCPHEGRVVKSLPKILLRGELLDVSLSEQAEEHIVGSGVS